MIRLGIETTFMRTKVVLKHKKQNHLSSKDKAVSCSEGLVNIHHREKPLVKLSEHSSRRRTLITAGIWKFWLCCAKIKICIQSGNPVCVCSTSEWFMQLRMEFRNSPTNQICAAPGSMRCSSGESRLSVFPLLASSNALSRYIDAADSSIFLI